MRATLAVACVMLVAVHAHVLEGVEDEVTLLDDSAEPTAKQIVMPSVLKKAAAAAPKIPASDAKAHLGFGSGYASGYGSGAQPKFPYHKHMKQEEHSASAERLNFIENAFRD